LNNIGIALVFTVHSTMSKIFQHMALFPVGKNCRWWMFAWCECGQ